MKFQKSKIRNKINKHCSKAPKINVQSMGSMYCDAGTYFIPDSNYESFLKMICDDVSKNTPIHYLERPNQKYNQVKIDLDLRFEISDDEKNSSNIIRRYDDEFIETLINYISFNLLKLIKDKDFTVYVLEKDSPSSNNKIIKDGIHIMIPDVVMENNALFHLRNSLIKDDNIIQLLQDISNSTPIEDVIDESIIKKNAWFLYGNGKPHDIDSENETLNYYKLTNAFIHKVGSSELKKMKKTKVETLHSKQTYDLTKLFSNYGKKINSEIKSDINIEHIDVQINLDNITTDNKLKFNFINSNNNSLSTEKIRDLLSCISKKNCDDYNVWRDIGMALYNIDDRNFTLWDNWSRTSSKYDHNQNKSMWNSRNGFQKYANKYNLGVNTIKKYAEKGDLNKYTKILVSRKMEYLRTWLYNIHRLEDYMKTKMGKGLDSVKFNNEVINYINNYTEFKMVCSNPNDNKWYKFQNHRWCEDTGANSLYLIMRDVLKADFEKLRNIIKNENIKLTTSMQMNSNMLTDSDSYNSSLCDGNIMLNDNDANFMKMQKENEIKEKLNNNLLATCDKVIQHLQNSSNRDKIVKDLAHKCYEELFYRNLDINADVFVCSNGVLDLKNMVFRKGEITDMVTISSNVEFPDENLDYNKTIEIEARINSFIEKIFVDEDIREYVLNKFAEKLSGKIFKEEFHIITGSGSNGKTQFIHLIEQVFGDYYVSFDNALLNRGKNEANQASPVIMTLRGCRLAITTEPKSTKPIETDKLKEFIGGDKLSGRHLHKETVSFTPQYAMMMQCNDIPEMNATDDGVWRKVRVVKCKSKFITRLADRYKLDDPQKYPYHFMGETIDTDVYKTWAPYFLKMLFERHKKLAKQNFRYKEPDEVIQATNEYKSEANIFEQFNKEIINYAPGYYTTVQNAYEQFRTFVSQNDSKNVASRKIFITQIEKFIGKPDKNQRFINYKFGDSGDPL